ncbi:MAG: DUF2029 domain-containing protein, partial [Planctomycetota bacterium]
MGLIVGYHCLCALRSIQDGGPDFEYFYKSGAWLLDHGARDTRYDINAPAWQLDYGGHDHRYEHISSGAVVRRGGIEWYLPFVSRVVSGLVEIGRSTAFLGGTPYRRAGVLWLAINVLALFAILRLAGTHLMGLPPRDWPVTLLLPFLALQLFWAWEFRLNQIDCLTMLLVVVSFVQWQQGRRNLPGFWMGLAVLLKLTPALLVVWFALKRQFRTVAVALATVVCAGPLADLAAFGPSYAADWYRGWAEIALVRGSHRGLILYERELEWRNQSISAIAMRLLHDTNAKTHFDNDPRIKRDDPDLYLNALTLPNSAVATIVLSIVAVSALALMWIARRPATQCSIWRLRIEWALFIVAMLWFMPVLRRYHFVMLLPALAVLAGCIHHCGWNSRVGRLGIATYFVLIAAQLSAGLRLWFRPSPSEAAGVFLFVLPVLALPLIVLLVRLARDPAALPDDPYYDAWRRGEPPSAPQATEAPAGVKT